MSADKEIVPSTLFPLTREGWREMAGRLAKALREVPVNGPIGDPRIDEMLAALSEYDRRMGMEELATLYGHKQMGKTP